MDILINQILAKATDIHTVDLKTRRTEAVSKEVDFTLTISGRMPLHLFDEEDVVEGQAEGDDAGEDCGLKFINGSTT